MTLFEGFSAEHGICSLKQILLFRNQLREQG